MAKKSTVHEAAPSGAAPSLPPPIDHAILANFVRKIGKKIGEDEVALYDATDPRFRVPYWISTGAPDLDQKLGGGIAGGRVVEIFSKNESEGKCVRWDTPILLHDGRVVAACEVTETDTLVGPDGLPRNVVSIITGEAPMYRVTPFKNGDPFYVTGNHRLALRVRPNNDESWSDVVMSVSEYLDKPEWWKPRHPYLYKLEGMDWPEAPLPVDPYYVGLWLGDGTTSKVYEVTNEDEEVIRYLHDLADRLGMVVRSYAHGKWNITKGHKQGGSQNAGPLVTGMKSLRLHETGKSHIPGELLRNSRFVRLAVLAGLVDSDGYLLENRQIEVTLKEKSLIDDLAFLCRSLGFACSVREKPVTYKGEVFTFFRARISGPLHEIPTRIARKQATSYEYGRDLLLSGFTVTLCERAEWVGIETDGDHLFCLGDFTVTHNSSVAATIARECQKLGGAVVWYDSEHTILPDYFKDFGLDISDLTFFYNPNLEGFFSAVEEFATGFREIFPTAPLLFVLDSVAAAQTASQEEADYEKAGVAAQARVMSASLRKLVPHLSKTQSTLVLVNQSRTKIGVMYGDDNDTPGGRAMKFYASQRIALRKVSKPLVDEKDRLIGIDVEAHIVKNKVAPPFKKSGFRLLFGRGISYTESAFDLLVRREVILGGAAGRYTYPGVVSGSFFKKEFPDILAAHPVIREEVSRQVQIPEMTFAIEVDPTLIEEDEKAPE